MTQQNAAMAEQTTAATGTLGRETVRLSALVDEFTLGKTAQGAAPTKVRRAPPIKPSPTNAAGALPRRRAAAGGSAGAADWSEF